jgi:hypothetical protein
VSSKVPCLYVLRNHTKYYWLYRTLKLKVLFVKTSTFMWPLNSVTENANTCMTVKFLVPSTPTHELQFHNIYLIFQWCFQAVILISAQASLQTNKEFNIGVQERILEFPLLIFMYAIGTEVFSFLWYSTRHVRVSV